MRSVRSLSFGYFGNQVAPDALKSLAGGIRARPPVRHCEEPNCALGPREGFESLAESDVSWDSSSLFRCLEQPA